MKLIYKNIEPKFMERTPPPGFVKDLKRFDDKLDVAFNRVSGFWEIYRKDRRGVYQWVLQVENEDETYRPLDNRTIKKLWEIDILARYGSIDNFERYLDNKLKKWQDDQQKQIDYEFKCDVKENRLLWQRAAENVLRGIINEPPEHKDKKLISYQKEEVAA